MMFKKETYFYKPAYLEAGRTFPQTMCSPRAKTLALQHRTVAGTSKGGCRSLLCHMSANSNSMWQLYGLPLVPRTPGTCMFGFLRLGWCWKERSRRREDTGRRGQDALLHGVNRRKEGLFWGRGEPVSRRQSWRDKA